MAVYKCDSGLYRSARVQSCKDGQFSFKALILSTTLLICLAVVLTSCWPSKRTKQKVMLPH